MMKDVVVDDSDRHEMRCAVCGYRVARYDCDFGCHGLVVTPDVTIGRASLTVADEVRLLFSNDVLRLGKDEAALRWTPSFAAEIHLEAHRRFQRDVAWLTMHPDDAASSSPAFPSPPAA